MKVLTVCERGNSRSVALAYILKDHLHFDAIAVGIRTASINTFQMLCDWADKIILVDKVFVEEIPDQFHSKLVIYDVGPDRYFLGFSQELLLKYKEYLKVVGL
jgi:galactitol-specific phosphotransferase system IIB component